MNLTQSEIRRGCDVAVLEMEKRIDQYRPPKPKVIQDGPGYIAEQIFLGSHGDIFAYGLRLHWNWIGIDGCVHHVGQLMHVHLRCIQKDSGRALRLVSMHRADYAETDQGKRCSHCGPNLLEWGAIVSNTSLQEF